MHRLILQMKAGDENIDWTAIPVVSGVNDQLIIQRHVQPLKDFQIIIALDEIFQAVIKLPVSNQDSQPAGSKVFSLSMAQPIEGLSQSEGVVWATPGVTFDLQSKRKASRDVSILPKLVIWIAISGAQKGPDISSNLLLEIDAKPVRKTKPPGLGYVFMQRRIIERCAEAAHIGALEITKETDRSWMAAKLVPLL